MVREYTQLASWHRMGDIESENVFKEVSGISFSFFRPEEVRNLSVVKITSATAFDQMNHPIAG